MAIYQFLLPSSSWNELDFTSMSDTGAVAGVLGSMIGYLGAEVAESAVFERLLWPERFYNNVTITKLIEMAFFMPMGGPLHKSALKTLDNFRKKGLYDSAGHGHMLGTAFYRDKKLTYQIHGYDGPDDDQEIRNGLWSTVLQECRSHKRLRTIQIERTDSEAMGSLSTIVRRTTQAVMHLHLWQPTEDSEQKKVRTFNENLSIVKSVLAISASEISALICAALIIAKEYNPWFGAYMCLPCVLKLVSLTTAVRREPRKPTLSEDFASKEAAGTVIVEINDYDHGFPLIEGPEPVVRQFFKHWGHPVRQNNRDRFREICGITLVVTFVLYFPIGLLSLLWVKQPVQIIWLAYQLYAIIVMHITRLRGSNGICRIEEGLATELANGKRVALKNTHGEILMARLESIPVARIRDGQAKVKEIIDIHSRHRMNRRSNSGSSDHTLVESDMRPEIRSDKTGEKAE